MSGRVPVRLLRENDVPAVTALLVADREHPAPWDPLHPDDHRTEQRYPCTAGEWQDHVLFQLLDEPGMR